MHDGHRRLQEAFEKNKVVEKENIIAVSASASVHGVKYYSPVFLFITNLFFSGRK